MSIILLSLISAGCLIAQPSLIRGEVRDIMTKKPLQGVEVFFTDNSLYARTDMFGKFVISNPSVKLDTLSFTLSSYMSLYMPLELQDTSIDLGIVYMRINLEEIRNNNQMILIEEDLGTGIENILNTGVLGANRDLLVKRAAFDFSQSFFKIRGYDSRNGTLLINGIPMNRMLRGRPQWNNWGGLNDVMRNQEYYLGLQASPWHFGDVLGVTNIETRPGSLRPGFRFSSSLSNKTYSGRIMLTYNSPPEGDGLGYTISGSRRWADEGYIDGTGYDAYSFYGALEYQFDFENSLYLTCFLTSNSRGSNSAITEEIYELAGREYNPYWGFQTDEIRNSRIRYINEPMLMLNYFHRSRKIDIETGLAYQWGPQRYSRIGYYNAPNPNPDYYRYLPSFYINSPIGANLITAASATEAFQADPQLNWSQLYQANRSPTSNGKASYLLYNDTVEQQSWRAHSNINLRIGSFSFLDLGFNYVDTSAAYYSRTKDLLGAVYHEDIDPFSETVNQLDSDIKRKNNEIFGYHYLIHSHQLDGFIQLRMTYGKWNGFLAGKYYKISYQREGLFRNGRYPDNSLGLSKQLKFSNYGIKVGISHEITKRHRLEAHGTYSYRAPVLADVFVNPRENNEIVTDIREEEVQSIDLSYIFNLPNVSGRLTGYYTRFNHTTDINFFYVDSGVGSDFVQQVITGLDRLHTGIEGGITVKPSSVVTLTAAASISKYLFASRPNLTINFDTAGPEEDLINNEGQTDLGPAEIKDLRMSRGPAHAISLGVEYRDPNYWWIGTTLNRLSENYISISPITRTKSFEIDPETGSPYPNATEENTKKLLRQKPLPEVYLLNINLGKSWIWGRKYISAFLSVSNFLDSVFRSGGYEQSRNGNFKQLYEDNISGRPSFGPKYWYGYGRTYFVNLSVSF